ncbi:lytic transglycosylase domain-containing protein [Sphingomonas sp. R647]|uniref:lytic transglycosylase domain-containing protein n=1 Tax=Sphingomonas sp. R647 TaxID=2875233 RepID=UPI001CD23143|nr:lytic transglycosylase domain-containing protein [Sphingomonas sp. R647]MCA1200159.1 lytic transglycosylase domain-containing protein [Sphingomonas sp. R647]
MNGACGLWRGVALALALLAPGLACAAQGRPAAPSCAGYAVFDEPVASAAERFAIPQDLIRAVIAVESNGKVFAISPKGAMGLMQLMPGTWEMLRKRLGLGHDPFDPCDNILAGSAYLRELLDRYGDPGFLAAYNAGPGRYEAYLRRRQGLPAETIAYVAKLTGAVLAAPARPVMRSAPNPDAWRQSDLFVRTPRSSSDPDSSALDASSKAGPGEGDQPSLPPRDTLFIARPRIPQ